MSKQKRDERNYLYLTVELEVAQNVTKFNMFPDGLILQYSSGCSVQPRQVKHCQQVSSYYIQVTRPASWS